MGQHQRPATQAEAAETGSGRAVAVQTVWAMVATFGAYLCMYGFRKPFTAATYGGEVTDGLTDKTVLVAAQVIGYTLSKFIGIRVVSEMPAHRRAAAAFGLILCGELALILFAIVPRPWHVACLFLNGLPLGMVFGMVLAPLEGRRLTEAMAAGLCTSFILAGGIMKSVGSWLLAQGVGEAWMPAAAGGLFLLPAAGFLFMLQQVRPPTRHDEQARSARSPMRPDQRRQFLRRYAAAFLPIVAVYVLVTIVRSLRDDFAPELWIALGQPAAPAVFTQTELLVALGVIIACGSTFAIGDNRRGFSAALAVCGGGFLLLAVTLSMQQADLIGAFPFMVLTGLGLYLPYVIIHTTAFERLLAITREPGTIGFLMYVADAFGYLAYVVVILGRSWLEPLISAGQADQLAVFSGVSWLVTGLSLFWLAVAWWNRPSPPATAPCLASVDVSGVSGN